MAWKVLYIERKPSEAICVALLLAWRMGCIVGSALVHLYPFLSRSILGSLSGVFLDTRWDRFGDRPLSVSSRPDVMVGWLDTTTRSVREGGLGPGLGGSLCNLVLLALFVTLQMGTMLAVSSLLGCLIAKCIMHFYLI